MKLKAIVAMACLLAAIFTSCEKNEVTTASGSCTFTIDGIDYATNDSRGYATDTTLEGSVKKVLTIQAITSNLRNHIAISVVFPDSLITGEFGDTSAYVLFSEIGQQTNSLESKQLTVKITSINSKQATGTFAGILENGEIEKPLTDGKFEVNIY